MDYVLQAIDCQWPNHGLVLGQAMDRIVAGHDPDRLLSPCRLTRSGSPVEFAFCWGAGTPRFTADPAPGSDPATRFAAAKSFVGRVDDPRLNDALQAAVDWQQSAQPDYGAWLGVRERSGNPNYKLYVEVPQDAPWTDWEQRIIGAPAVLPSRGVRLCMLGLDACSSTLELYYRIDMLYPFEIDTLLRRVGLPARSKDVTTILETLNGRTFRREIPCGDIGFSYSFPRDGRPVFTLYAFAHSLMGNDDSIRCSILSLLSQRGWDASAYETASEPLVGLRSPMTFHGMVGCIVPSDGPVGFTVGLAPYKPTQATSLLREVRAEQASDGGFLSHVEDVTDENCFVTALVLLETPKLPNETITRALDFLERCEDPQQPGAFRFYPFTGDSPRLSIRRLPADADDTALAWLALLKHGRRNVEAAKRAIQEVIEPHRAHFLRGDEPPWVRRGAVRTWLIPAARDNPVDCCVNANVAALYAVAGESTHPCCVAACQTIAAAVEATNAAPQFMRTVAPFYLHPIELLYATRRAVQLGAQSLAGTLATLEAQPWSLDDRTNHWPRRRPVCSNAGGRPIWIAPALQAARELNSISNIA